MSKPKPRVVIIGGGFGGLAAARALRRADIELTLVDRLNHHTFQPLLYQVATSSLAPSDITAPLRWLLRRQKNARVFLGEARSIDIKRRTVHVVNDIDWELPYDYLIVAAGSRHSYFGHDEWEPLAPGLKTVADAVELRQRFLLAFEEAELHTDPALQQAYLTFVIVGGGPTGVELAGAMPLIVRRAFRDDFRRVDTTQTRVILLEAADRVLSAYPAALSERARRDLEELGVDVRTGALVTRIEPEGVTYGRGREATHIPARTVFWAAGNAAAPIAGSLGAPVDRVGRVLVNPDLSVPDHPESFVIGDLAYIEQDGIPVPGVAPAAIQEGRCAAENLLRSLRGAAREPFRYVNKGAIATIGRNKAVADFGRVRVAGRVAWWLWLFVHILYLVGFRNRLSVLLAWAYAYLTYRRGVRLILDSRRTERRSAAGVRASGCAAGGNQ